MSRPGVLVLSDDAAEYLPLLAGLARQGTELAAAASASAARSAWSGQPVVLGRRPGRHSYSEMGTRLLGS